MTDSHQRRHSPRLWILLSGLIAAASLSVFGQARLPAPGPASRADFAPKPPIIAKTAEEQAKTFVLPPGYRMELVLSDPDIITPGGHRVRRQRPHVRRRVHHLHARRRGHGPARADSAASARWEDTNGDGTYDKHTVFADKLVLPRMILPLDNDSILTNETALGRRDQADRHERRRRRRQARGVLHAASASAATATSSTSRAASCGGSTTGSTAPTTRSASAGRRRGIVREPTGLERRPVGPVAGRRRQDVVRVTRAASADRSTSRCRFSTAPSRIARRVRAGLRHRVADRRPRRHAGRHGPRAHADRQRSNHFDGHRRTRHRPRPSRPGGSRTATCSSPSRSAA